MDIDNEKKYCQSCGMPLDIEGISEYGTNSDGTLNQEFLFLLFKLRQISF